MPGTWPDRPDFDSAVCNSEVWPKRGLALVCHFTHCCHCDLMSRVRHAFAQHCHRVWGRSQCTLKRAK
eukprot:11458978-Alexandrium_andersonii.AAC.1